MLTNSARRGGIKLHADEVLATQTEGKGGGEVEEDAGEVWDAAGQDNLPSNAFRYADDDDDEGGSDGGAQEESPEQVAAKAAKSLLKSLTMDDTATTFGAHFQFRDEREGWADSLTRDMTDMLSVNLDALTAKLYTIPFHIRADIPPALLTDDLLDDSRGVATAIPDLSVPRQVRRTNDDIVKSLLQGGQPSSKSYSSPPPQQQQQQQQQQEEKSLPDSVLPQQTTLRTPPTTAALAPAAAAAPSTTRTTVATAKSGEDWLDDLLG
ncbi:hypothetical protein RI367_006016 [Sorochytrium milnesiophthora]